MINDMVEYPEEHTSVMSDEGCCDSSVFGLAFDRNAISNGDTRATPADETDIEAANRMYVETQRHPKPNPSDCLFKLYSIVSGRRNPGLNGCRKCNSVTGDCGYMPISGLSYQSRQALIRLTEEADISDEKKESLLARLD
ncbi:MAG: hypothetical protein AABX54_02785 [Nanoarchaeota archaeon]